MSNDALIPTSNYKASSFVGQDISIEEAMEKLAKSKPNVNVSGMVINGTFEDYVMLLAQRYHKLDVGMKGNLLVLNSHDGAEHNKTESIPT